MTICLQIGHRLLKQRLRQTILDNKQMTYFLHQHLCCHFKAKGRECAVQRDIMTEQTFAFRDLVVTVKKRNILDHAFGEVKSGSMMAVMGPSGAGKSTLFNALVGNMKLAKGEISYKNHAFGRTERRNAAYVLQSDVFYKSLTLKQTLNFYAQVNLPEHFSKNERQERIDDVVEFLELSKCLNTQIGDVFSGGLSGGEKKRTSIACELLRDPEILLLDEPTSSLDSSLAFNIMSKLKHWASSKNRIVLATIHQPSSQLFYLFHELLLLADGQVAYFGQVEGLVSHMQNLGMTCPSNWNPADFILSVVHEQQPLLEKMLESVEPTRTENAKNFRTANGSSLAFYNIAVEIEDNVKTEKERNFISGENRTEVTTSIKGPEFAASFWRQYWSLTQRYFVTSRNRIFSPVHIGEAIVLAALAACICSDLWFTDMHQRDRLGVIFIIMIIWSFDSIMDSVRSFPEHRQMLMKERNAHQYRMSAFLMALQTADMPMVILLPSAFFTIIYFIARLSQGVAYIYGLLVLMLNCVALQGVGITMGIAFKDPNWSITAALTFMIGTMLCGGFFIKHFPIWIDWIRYLSIVNYSYGLMLQVLLPYGQEIKCPETLTVLSSTQCLNGTSYQQAQALNDIPFLLPMWANIAILFGFLFFVRLCSYLILLIRLKPKRY